MIWTFADLIGFLPAMIVTTFPLHFLIQLFCGN